MSSFIASVRINFSPLIQSLDIVATKSTCPFSRKTISSNFRKWQSRNVENIKVPRAVFSIAHAKRNSFVASSKSSKLVHCPTFCTTLHSLISGEILFICCCLCILLDMSRFLGQFGLTWRPVALKVLPSSLHFGKQGTGHLCACPQLSYVYRIAVCRRENVLNNFH